MIRCTPVPSAMRLRPAGIGRQPAAGQLDDGIAAVMLHHADLAGGDVLEIEHVLAAGALDAAAVVELPDVLERDLGPEIVVRTRRAGRADVAQHVLVHQGAAELLRRDRPEHGLDLAYELLACRRHSGDYIGRRGGDKRDCTADRLRRPHLGPRRREDRLQGLERRARPVSRHAGAHRARRSQSRRPAGQDRGRVRAVRRPLRLARAARLARLLRADRGRQGHHAARRARRRGADLADPAGGRAADRDLAPRCRRPARASRWC